MDEVVLMPEGDTLAIVLQKRTWQGRRTSATHHPESRSGSRREKKRQIAAW
jgi:hypothetical protein